MVKKEVLRNIICTIMVCCLVAIAGYGSHIQNYGEPSNLNIHSPKQ